MQFPSSLRRSAGAVVVLSCLLAPAASMLNCEKIVADGHEFNLKKLEGAHSVIISQRLDGKLHNTTYTTDICRPLKRKGDVKPEDQCPLGANGEHACPTPRTWPCDQANAALHFQCAPSTT